MGNYDKRGWVVEMTYFGTPVTTISATIPGTYLHAYKRVSKWFQFYSEARDFAEQESKSKDDNVLIIVMPFLMDANKGEGHE